MNSRGLWCQTVTNIQLFCDNLPKTSHFLSIPLPSRPTNLLSRMQFGRQKPGNNPSAVRAENSEKRINFAPGFASGFQIRARSEELSATRHRHIFTHHAARHSSHTAAGRPADRRTLPAGSPHGRTNRHPPDMRGARIRRRICSRNRHAPAYGGAAAGTRRRKQPPSPGRPAPRRGERRPHPHGTHGAPAGSERRAQGRVRGAARRLRARSERRHLSRCPGLVTELRHRYCPTALRRRPHPRQHPPGRDRGADRPPRHRGRLRGGEARTAAPVHEPLRAVEGVRRAAPQHRGVGTAAQGHPADEDRGADHQQRRAAQRDAPDRRPSFAARGHRQRPHCLAAARHLDGDRRGDDHPARRCCIWP